MAKVTKPKPRAVVAPAAEPIASVSDEPIPAQPGLPRDVRREIRREDVARRIADRMEQRAERRAAMGLPPGPQGIPPKMQERLHAMPPPERAALMRRVREIRAERAPSDPPFGEETLPRAGGPRENWRDRLTPEQRQQMRDRREQRRIWRDSQSAEPILPQP